MSLLFELGKQAAMRKQSLSLKPIMGAFQRATARGITPERGQKFMGTMQKWLPGAMGRNTQALNTVNNAAPALPRSAWEWMPRNMHGEETQLLPQITQAISQKIPRPVAPLQRVGLTGYGQGINGFAYPAEQRIQMRIGDSTNALLHEAGHFGQGGFVPQAPTLPRNIWQQELMANRNARQMLPQMQQIPQLAGQLPTRQAYGQWMQPQLEGYRQRLLRNLLQPAGNAVPAAEQLPGWLQRFQQARQTAGI